MNPHPRFSEFLIAKGKAVSTATAYERDVQRCEVWLKTKDPHLEWSAVTPCELYAYLSTLKSPNHHNRAISSLKQWFSYLHKVKGFERPNPADQLKRRRRHTHLPRYLTADEVKQLVVTAYEHSRRTERHRNAALIAFMYGTGLRVSEVCALKIDAIQFRADQPESITTGRGTSRHSMPLSASAQKALTSWLYWSRQQFKLHPEEHGGFVWVAVTRAPDRQRRGQPLEPQAVRFMLERYGVRAGIKLKVTPNLLRNTFANELAKAGVSHEVVRALLGHKVEVYPDSLFDLPEAAISRAIAKLPDVWQA